MALPTSRQEFSDKCLRALGYPVHNVEIAEQQIEDCIDNAIQYWQDYHFDGAEKTYYKHQISDTDKANRYITLPDNIFGAVRVFPINDPSISSDSLFNIRYQIALNDLYTLTSDTIVPYYMALQHLQLLTEVLIGQQPIRYNRHSNVLYIDMDWETVNTGEFLLVEAYQVMDPETYSSAWKDRWLLRYATQLMKKQWGENTKKYAGMPLVGGLQFNGQQIYDEATREIEILEQEMNDKYGGVLEWYMG